MATHQSRRWDELTRRAFVQAGALSLLGLRAWTDEPAAAPAPVRRRPTGKHIIYLSMAGGMSHLDTFDPKPGSEVQGPVEAIPTTVDGIRISENFPLLAQRMRDVALIRSVSSNQGAHEQGAYYVHTSFAPRGTIQHPSLGAWMLRFRGSANPTLPGNVVIGGGSNYPGVGYLDPQYAPILLGKAGDGLPHVKLPNGVSPDQFARRMEAADEFNRAYQQRIDTAEVRAYQHIYAEAVALMGSRDLAAFDLSKEPKNLRELYGDHPFAQGCLLARRLVEYGVAYVEVTLGGWDTHADNFEKVADQAFILDTALAALIADLRARGLLEETLIAVTTEFGRSPEINANKGRDHHPQAFSCLLAGGGIAGGRVHGSTDERGAAVAEDRVEVPDLNATIAYAAGLPLDEVVHSPGGRPFTLADHGKPLLSLFA